MTWNYHSLCLIRNKPAEVKLHRLCNSNSNAGDAMHNSRQRGVIDITDKLILQNMEKLRGVQEQQWSQKHCPPIPTEPYL